MNKKNPPNAMVRDESTSLLLKNLRDLIQSARQRALRAVDTVQVQTCWEIGRHIVEFEQGGSARAEYGSQLLQTLAAGLAAEFGRGSTSRTSGTCAFFITLFRFVTHCVMN